jgi:uncharacterized protein (TIGR04222 family)
MEWPIGVNTPAQRELWERLVQWSPDPEGERGAFTRKLAREQGWSLRRAERVLGEYRRFLFLAVNAGHGVCPSEAVDRAWHQHLLDTRPYWEEFCPQVLGMPLHHSPSRGSLAERQWLADGYARTLASYRRCFGGAPPADLWPPPARRFSGGHRGWRLEKLGRLAPLGGLVSLALLLGSCGLPRGEWSPFRLTGAEFLVLYLGLMAAAMMIGRALGHWAGADPQPGRPLPLADSLTSREMAYLVGGERQVGLTTLVALRERGALERPWTLADPIEREVALAATARPLGLRDWPGHASIQALTDLKQRLTQLGLLVEERRHRRARGAVLAVGLAVLALGVLRLGQGWLAGQPIGYLTMLCVVQVFLSLGMGQTPPRATRRGEALVARQRRAVHIWLPGESLDLRLMALAVLGVAALPAAEAAALAPLVPELAAGASDGGSGGCGGSGCGGCGGCGGG